MVGEPVREVDRSTLAVSANCASITHFAKRPCDPRVLKTMRRTAIPLILLEKVAGPGHVALERDDEGLAAPF